MAELSAADKKVLFPAGYKEPEVTAASRAEAKATSRASMRKVAIGVTIFGFIILLAVLFGSQGIVR
jgi:hypothetical protein